MMYRSSSKAISRITAVIIAAVIIVIAVGIAAFFLTAKPAKPAPAPLKKVTLTIEYCEFDKDLFKPAIKKLKEVAKRLGYDLTVNEIMIPYGVDCASKIAADLAAGTAGDILEVDSFQLWSMADAGYLMPITDFVKNWTDWKKFFPAIRRMVTYKGEVWGLILTTDVRMLFYRKDIFKIAGLPENWQPKNWTDILKAAEILKEHADEIKKRLKIDEFYPILIPAGLKWGEATTAQGFYMLLLGADRDPYNRLYDYSKGKWVCKSTALYRAFKFYINVFKNGYSSPKFDLAADPWYTHRKAFSEGIVAIDFGGSWEFYEGWGPNGIAPLKPCVAECKGLKGGEYKECFVKCEWKYIGIAKMPSYSGGKEGERKFVTLSGGWVIVINSKVAKDPIKEKLAYEFLKIIASKDIVFPFAAKYAKIATRTDAPSWYFKDPYIRLIYSFLNFTDYRDTLSDYPKVSKVIQEVTQMIIEGKIDNADKALDTYCKLLKEAVGPENVIEYPVKK